MNSRPFYSSFWSDGFIGSLSPIDKLIFLNYLFTPKVSLLFCFEHPDRQVVFETGATIEQVKAFKKLVEPTGKILFFKDYVYLANASRFETLSGSRVEQGRSNAFARLPHDVQDWYTSITSPIHTPKIPLSEPKVELKAEAKENNSRYWLRNLPADDVERLSSRFHLSPEVVVAEAAKCANWHEDKDTKNFRQALDNWLTKAVEFQSRRRTPDEVPFTDLSHLANAEAK